MTLTLILQSYQERAAKAICVRSKIESSWWTHVKMLSNEYPWNSNFWFLHSKTANSTADSGPLKNWLKFETSFWYLSFEIMNRPYVKVIQFCLYFICIQAIDKRILNGKPITEMDFGKYSFNKISLNQFGQKINHFEQVWTNLDTSKWFWTSLNHFEQI